MVAKSIAKIYTNIHKPTDYVEQIVRILGVNRANYDTSTKVGM